MLAELFNRRLRDHGEVDALHDMARRAVDRVDDRGTGGAWRHRADRLRKHEVVDEEGALAWGKELGQPHRLEILIGGRGGVEWIVRFRLAAARAGAPSTRERGSTRPGRFSTGCGRGATAWRCGGSSGSGRTCRS